MHWSNRHTGKWSAIAIVLLSAAYIVTGATWLFTARDTAAARLQPSDPYLAILESLILASSCAIVPLFAAIYSIAPNNKKAFGLAAFGFALLLVAMTGAVHTISLMAVRGTTNANVAETFALYSADGRLTPLLSVDLLGWDLFFGLAMLFAATPFRHDRLKNTIRIGLILGGSMCLIGFSGPASGALRFQFLAIIGYAFVFPAVCVPLAIFFSRHDGQPKEL